MKTNTWAKRALVLGLATTMMATSLTGCGKPERADGELATVEAPEEIKIATVVSGESSPTLQALRLLEKNLEEESGGRFDVVLFTGGVLGGDMDVVDYCRRGDLEMTTVNPMSISSTITPLAVMEQYYLFDDDAHALRFMNGEGGQVVLDSFQQMKMQGVAYMPLGFRNLTNDKKAIESMDDLKGLKIRGYNPTQIAVWEAVGCNLSNVAWNELFTAMQQSLIDGQEGALTSFSESKFYEVQEYFSFTRHTYSADILIASQKWIDSLHPDDWAMISEQIEIAEQWQQQELQRQNDALIAELEQQAGTKFNEVPADVLAEMAEKMGAVTEAKIVGIAGQEKFDEIIGYANACRE